MTETKSLGQLLGETTRMWRGLLDRRLKPLGVSGARWLVLLHTSRAGRPLTQNELANRLGIGRSSLVGLLDRMAEDGWIERRPDTTDRRRNLVHLAPRAVDTLPAVEAEAEKLYRELTDGLPAKDIEAMRHVLRHIQARVETSEEP